MADVRRLAVVSVVVGAAASFGTGCATPQEEPTPSTGSAVIEVMDFETGEIPTESISGVEEDTEGSN
jgi:hypothetical protein